LKDEIMDKIAIEPQQVENMRAKDASRYLACGKSTLWLWVSQSKIKAYKISERVTIFKRSELDAFINASAEVSS